MIVVKLVGGQGNQMFQYAFGRSLAYQHGHELALDASEFLKPKSSRRYGLNRFPILAKFLSLPELLSSSDFIIGITELQQGFHEDVTTGPYSQKCTFFVQGFWQSERYFKVIEETIRRDFSFNKQPEGEWFDRIAATKNAACLHVRRTDYLLPQGSHLGALELGYYYKAARSLTAWVEDLHLFVFSDDINWCRQHLELPFKHTLVERRGSLDDDTGSDLQLMSSCNHFIIANSTFSWWAAWLSQNKKKIVIAPARWYTDPKVKSAAIVPSSWIRL